MRARYLLPILTFAMIMLIWGHSLMPGEVSASESGFLTELLTGLFHITGSNTEHTIRKCAHFFEYMILGILFSADSVLFTGRRACAASVFPGLAVAQTDETIQLFVADRGGSLLDVWLDYSGYVTGIVFFGVIYGIVHSRKGIKKGSNK